MAAEQDTLSDPIQSARTGCWPTCFPIALIPRVLKQLSRSRNCRMLLIVLLWARQMWFPKLLSLLVAEQISLPLMEGLIPHLDKTKIPLMTIKTLHLHDCMEYFV